MSGKIEMSLDDIIKQNKKNKPKKSPGKRPAAGGKKPATAGSATKRRSGPVRNPRKPGGGVIRNRSQGSIAKRRPGASFGRSVPSNKRDWGFAGGPARRFGSGSESTKLIVSNLDFGVTDSDILELFSEFGPLKSAGVHYDRSGRSMGSADLIFERRADAIKAMKQYNGVPLDGREMNIQLATSEIPGSNPIRGGNRLGSFNKAKGGAAKRGNQQRGAGNKKSGPGGNAAQKRKAKPGGGRAKKPAPPTAEELDAQLEEYVKSKVSTSEGA